MQVGKVKKTKEDKPTDEGVGMNVKSIVVVALMMILMLFAVHCTWVTSNAYSSPSIVLASYGHDGYVPCMESLHSIAYIFVLSLLPTAVSSRS